jgi:hypothetical protein
MGALLSATQGGDLTPAACRDLVAAGHADLLIGQREVQWLDGKGTPYHLESDGQKLELAKDVAAFANARAGGVLVVGATTTKEPAGDRITKISPFPQKLFDPARYHSIIGDRVFPAIDGLEVEAVTVSAGQCLGVLFIPPQGEELKPFLVRGVDVGSKYDAHFVSIPGRHGETTRYASIASIHALLQAGRLSFNQLAESEVAPNGGPVDQPEVGS